MTSIPCWPGYAVTSDGRVFSFWRRVTQERGGPQRQGIRSIIGEDPRELPSFDRKNRKGVLQGYRSVCLSCMGRHKNFYVHDLVLRIFVGERPSPDHEALHRNGERADNRLENLRWGTPKENAEDRQAHARHLRSVPTYYELPTACDEERGWFDDLLAQGAA